MVRSAFRVLHYDEAAARWHAFERARLEAMGCSTRHVDGQIAAVARVNELILVTANTKGSEGFDGLTVEDWSSSPPFAEQPALWSPPAGNGLAGLSAAIPLSTTYFSPAASWLAIHCGLWLTD